VLGRQFGVHGAPLRDAERQLYQRDRRLQAEDHRRQRRGGDEGLAEQTAHRQAQRCRHHRRIASGAAGGAAAHPEVGGVQ